MLLIIGQAYKPQHPACGAIIARSVGRMKGTVTVNSHQLLTLGACAARVTVVGLCVCLSVCVSVDDYSRTTGYEAAYERYQQLQCYKGMKNNVAILLKRLRSRDMA